VPGEGPPGAEVVVVGEAPGRPFVGRSGRYLDLVLGDLGVLREEFCITSILKCFYPMGPKVHQVELCLPWTEAQVKAVGRAAILVMGLTATSGLLAFEA